MTATGGAKLLVDFAFTVYLLGNSCLLGSATILLYNNHKKVWPMTEASKNMQILLMISSFMRLEWTAGLGMKNGPRLWGEAHDIFDVLCKTEGILSCLMWTLCVIQIPYSEKEKKVVSPKFRWYSMLVWCLIGPGMLVFNSTTWDKNFKLTWYAFIAPYNMAMDTLSLIPQILILRSTKEQFSDADEAPPPWLGHVVGLLSVMHLSRVIFWTVFFWRGIPFFSFMFPDLVGVLVMSDFLILYIQLARMHLNKALVHQDADKKFEDMETGDSFYDRGTIPSALYPEFSSTYGREMHEATSTMMKLSPGKDHEKNYLYSSDHSTTCSRFSPDRNYNNSNHVSPFSSYDAETTSTTDSQDHKLKNPFAIPPTAMMGTHHSISGHHLPGAGINKGAKFTSSKFASTSKGAYTSVPGQEMTSNFGSNNFGQSTSTYGRMQSNHAFLPQASGDKLDMMATSIDEPIGNGRAGVGNNSSWGNNYVEETMGSMGADAWGQTGTHRANNVNRQI